MNRNKEALIERMKWRIKNEQDTIATIERVIYHLSAPEQERGKLIISEKEELIRTIDSFLEDLESELI